MSASRDSVDNSVVIENEIEVELEKRIYNILAVKADEIEFFVSFSKKQIISHK